MITSSKSRPRPSQQGNRPRLRLRARTRIPAKLIYDLIAGMLEETEANWREVRSQDHRDVARQRHHLPDGSALQHRHLPANESRGQTRRPRRRLGHQARLGRLGLRRAGEERLHRRQRLHRLSSPRKKPASSIATASGPAPISSASASPPSVICRAPITRTSTSSSPISARPGRPMAHPPRPHPQCRRAPNPRIYFTAQARRRELRLFPAKIRRGPAPAFCRPAANPPRLGLRRHRRRHRPPQPRGPPASGPPPPRILPPANTRMRGTPKWKPMPSDSTAFAPAPHFFGYISAGRILRRPRLSAARHRLAPGRPRSPSLTTPSSPTTAT